MPESEFEAAWLDSVPGKLSRGKVVARHQLKKGQVRVGVRLSGVCGSQVMEARGKRGEDRWLPHLLGHEAVGQVLEIGPDVTKIQPGQDVVLTWIKGAGCDTIGGTVEAAGRTINAGPVTTFSEVTIVSENRVVPLPHGITDDVGVLFGCALPTGLGMVINELKPKSGESVILIGLGGVGLCALMGLVISGCSPVIAVDPSPSKRSLAKDIGATHVWDPQASDIRDQLFGIIPEGVDYGVDAAGRAETIELAFDSIRKNGGQCIFASHPPSNQKIRLSPHDLISGKQIRGSWGGGSVPDRDFPRYAEYYRRGELPLEKIIGRRYPLSQINEALDELESGMALRPLLDMALIHDG